MDCNQDIEAILATESILTNIEMNDVLMNELYSKERGVRVEFFGIQLDEV